VSLESSSEITKEEFAMEEIEVPLEKSQEDIHHQAMHGDSRWIMGSALLSAFLAVFAAIFALMAGASVNEAMIAQMKASDTWSYYQAKGIKAGQLETKILILEQQKNSEKLEAAHKKLESYRDDQDDLSEKAKTLEEHSEHLVQKHEIFARSVTFFQIAIALTAIAVLTRRRHFVWLSGFLGIIGLIFGLQALFFK
jgi:hypothetical protein